MNKANKNNAIRLLVWIAIVEAIIIGGMVMAFLSIIIDPIAIAANYENGAEEFVVPVASTPIYAEVEPSRSAYPKPTPSTPIYEEVVKEPEINWSEIIDVEDYASEPHNLEMVSDGYVRPPLNDEVYRVVNGIPVTNRELHMLGLSIWGEANGQSMMEQAAVAWAILNRVDQTGYARGKSLTHVITYHGQIHGYKNTKGARCADYWLMIAVDVVDRWALEWGGAEAKTVGRVLPKEYTFWVGANGHNYFRTAYKTNEPRWGWSLPNPYEEA